MRIARLAFICLLLASSAHGLLETSAAPSSNWTSVGTYNAVRGPNLIVLNSDSVVSMEFDFAAFSYYGPLLQNIYVSVRLPSGNTVRAPRIAFAIVCLTSTCPAGGVAGATLTTTGRWYWGLRDDATPPSMIYVEAQTWDSNSFSFRLWVNHWKWSLWTFQLPYPPSDGRWLGLALPLDVRNLAVLSQPMYAYRDGKPVELHWYRLMKLDLFNWSLERADGPSSYLVDDAPTGQAAVYDLIIAGPNSLFWMTFSPQGAKPSK